MIKIRKLQSNINQMKTGRFVSRSRHIIKIYGFYGAISYPGNVVLVEGEKILNIPENTIVNFSTKKDLSDNFSIYLIKTKVICDVNLYNQISPHIISMLSIIENSVEDADFLFRLINKDAERVYKKSKREEDNYLSNKVYDLISKNPQNHWTVNEICRHLYLSKATLVRRVQQENTTLSELILSARMHRAVCLMFNKSYSIKQVAYLTGFSSTSYFCKKFKDTYGSSPKQFMTLMR
ncbi:AraC family transcriptional regulator [Vibrio splendidus]|uniref:helix-turn-helix domain-containing protein n=2 Tax=Vibrionaceae TaxID=641 RepID=UPI000E326BAD